VKQGAVEVKVPGVDPGKADGPDYALLYILTEKQKGQLQ
jgi:hypothetical protein